MANNAEVTLLGILTTIAITAHEVSMLATFFVIDMPHSSNFPLILGRSWLREMNAIHDWCQKKIQIHRNDKTVVTFVDIVSPEPRKTKFGLRLGLLGLMASLMSKTP